VKQPFPLGAAMLLALLLKFCCAARGQDPTVKESPASNLKAKFQRDFRGGDPKNPNLRFIHGRNVRWESGGARITMPASQGKLATAGVAVNFQVKGDFEITASFEILKAETPSEGYGVGVSIYAAIDSNAGDAISLARRVGVNGNPNYLSDRMTPNPAKGEPDHDVKTRLSNVPTGKLRIKRVGATVRFLIADGDSVDFVPIFQDDNQRIDTEIGTADIRYFQVGGDAGDSESALDLRLLDLMVEAEDLPGLIPTARRAPPAWMLKAKGVDAQPAAAPSHWPMILGSLGASTGLLALGVGAWLLVRRRADQRKKRAQQPTAPTIAFACPECGRRLRARAKSAGKKLRCPNCKVGAQVPKPDAIEAEPS
jgi:predicted RNA-binding Zn-ribbon protein involved in translation (DUF1610 family)